MCERLRFIGLGGNCIARRRSQHIEQLARPRDVLDALAAGKQAVVADAVEAVRQHMDQEAD